MVAWGLAVRNVPALTARSCSRWMASVRLAAISSDEVLAA